MGELNKKEIVYVSGPITAPDREQMEQNLLKGIMAGAKLFEEGVTPLIPHNNPIGVESFIPMNWKRYMQWDLELLKLADSIYMIEGWEKSRGSRIEHWLAKRWNKKVYYDKVNWPAWVKEKEDERQCSRVWSNMAKKGSIEKQ